MSYIITQYTRRKARQYGVTVKKSSNLKKKLDVYKRVKGSIKKVASIGATGYGDYPTFIRKKGITSANKHRRRYKIRHEKNRHRIGTPGYYADKLLW